jgi:hypothetical protein
LLKSTEFQGAVLVHPMHAVRDEVLRKISLELVIRDEP